MRICFVNNVASQSFLLARELIKRGHVADIFTTYSQFCSNTLKSGHEYGKLGIPGVKRLARFYLKHIKRKYDVEIYSFCTPYTKAKRHIPYYHGSDARDGLMPIEYPCIYATKDLDKYLNGGNAVWIPRAVYLDIFKPTPRPEYKDKLIVGHFPTDPALEERDIAGKGTPKVYRAIQILQQEQRINVELRTGLRTHEEMPDAIKQCHVICDQFGEGVGQYGLVGLESIASNRPVVCYVKPEHFEYPEIQDQIINCDPTPESIADAILQAVDKQVDPSIIERLYSPSNSADIMENALKSWGYI